MAGPFCDKHENFAVRIEHMERDIHSLWDKWDSIQKTMTGVFITLCLNLIGVVFILLRG
jgi:hypothetical protein